jgi:hypothetical protein
VIHTMRVYKSDSHKDLKFAATCSCQTDGRFASEHEAVAYAEKHRLNATKGINSVVIVNEIHPVKSPTDAASATIPPYAKQSSAAPQGKEIPPYARKS